MKKLLTLFSFIFIANIAFSQCVADSTLGTGVFPDSTTNLPDAPLNVLYDEVITLNIPTDTTIVVFGQNTNVPIDSIVLTDFTGFPVGFSYNCSPSSCVFAGGSSGCIQITGTPTNAADIGTIFDLTANMTLYTTLGGQSQSAPLNPINYYSITIVSDANAVGIKEENKNSLTVSQNSPNPATGITTINYTTTNSSTAQFEVYDLIGNKVFSNIYQAETGGNSIKFDAGYLPSGLYIYSLTTNGKIVTKKMTVDR